MQTRETPIRQSEFLIGLKREQLEELPWAITKVNRQGVFTYGNRAMCDIVGLENIEGKTLADLFRGDDLVVVREHLENRFSRGAADEYEVEAIRPTDGARVPVRCLAMPEVDNSGEVVGAIAIIHDLLAEDVSAKIHKAVEDERVSRAILRAVASQCERIVPFDMFGLSLFSADGEHSRIFYLYPEDQFQPGVRWRRMSGYEKKLIETKRVVNVADIEEWLARPEWRQYRDDPEVQGFIRWGLHSSLSFPVVSGGRVVARFGFARKRDKGPFSKLEEERLGRLPLRAAVRMVVHCGERDELKFRLELITKIVSGRGSTEIAETVIHEIAQHYGWENVSIFQPDLQRRQFRLVKQKAQGKAFLLPDDWHHPIDRGITGRVFQTQKPLNVSDVTAPEFKDVYLAGYPGSRSELCMPILVGDGVYWVLNVEDSQQNAFAKEEQEGLESILKEVAVVLELVSRTRIFTELLDHTQDSVIQTDFQGKIVQANQATKRLLGYSEDEMKHKAFANYFKDKDQAQLVQAAEAEYVPNEEVRLLRKDHSEASVLLSGTSLPREIGRKIYICNDLSTHKPIETMEILRRTYNEIASQIKTPLSLAFTWLAKLQRIESQPEAADILTKTLKQLNKVDLTYDHLLFYERVHEREGTIAPTEKSVFEVPLLLKKIMQEMPDSESAQIVLTAEPDVPMVRADLFQLWFCVESVLAYLLRFVAESGKISVTISARRGVITVAIRGHAPPVTGGAITDYDRSVIHAITEMALGEEVIQNFIENNHSGAFRKRPADGNLMEYVMELPSA